jgi:hypothetical protein
MNKRGSRFALAACLFLVAQVSAAQGDACDRACLTGILDAYLSALTARDPGKAPVAAQYRATEDAVEVRLGDGLWKTATGLGAYRIDMADPVSGNVGYIGEVLEGDGRVTIALRLLVRDRKIVEIETILGRGRVPGTSIVPTPRASLSQIVPRAERLSRDRMIETANANFDAILNADGSIYADDCQRIENRMAMSGNPDLDYPIGTIPGKPKPHFGSMGCREQIEAHLFDQLDEVEPRRFVLVDEEKQLVLGVYIMRWYKKGRCNEIPNYGRICHEQPRKPVALLNAELLGVRGGKIHEIEAVFKFADYDSDSGWEGDLRSAGSDSASTCARDCLYRHLDSYLSALDKRDPASLRTASDFRYTENGSELRLGQGLWETATGRTSYEARAADPKTGQVAVIGEVKEGEKAVSFATRLKIEAGVIAEAETVIGRSFTPNHPSMPTSVRPRLRSIVPSDQRISREEMIATAQRNFDNLLRNDGSHFADDCQRIENRMPMSGNPQLDYPITPIPGKPKPHFGSMGCQQQVEAHLFDTLDSVDPRRFLVIDEEQQIVFGVLSLRFYGRTACNDIPGYGRTCPQRKVDPISLLSAEMLGVRGGKIHEVEVVFTRMPYDATHGWQ